MVRRRTFFAVPVELLPLYLSSIAATSALPSTWFSGYTCLWFCGYGLYLTRYWVIRLALTHLDMQQRYRRFACMHHARYPVRLVCRFSLRFPTPGCPACGSSLVAARIHAHRSGRLRFTVTIVTTGWDTSNEQLTRSCNLQPLLRRLRVLPHLGPGPKHTTTVPQRLPATTRIPTTRPAAPATTRLVPDAVWTFAAGTAG